MMVGITASDYASESRKFKSKRRTRVDQKITQVKIKLPTQMKTEKLYCRNCLRQLESNRMGKPCKQCGKTTVPLKRRK